MAFPLFGRRGLVACETGSAGPGRAGEPLTRIFTVDDEPPIQDLYEAVVGIAGFELAGQAFDGARAVEMYRLMTPPPDLVVMDFRMPIMDGLEAAREIMRLDARARIVFVSADGSIEKAARDVGAVAFLAKPFPLAAFIAIVKGLAGEAQRPAGTSRGALV